MTRTRRTVATVVHHHNGAGVHQLRSNLARIRPDLDADQVDAVTRAGVASYLRYWSELIRLPGWRLQDLRTRTRTVNEAEFREAYARGNGVVAALPHMANWDWAGAWACGTGMPVATVAEQLRPERLFDQFVALRTRLGMEVLPLTADTSTYRRLRQWTRAGGLVCLLADRDLTGTGVEVRLCGQRALMPRGPAVLARQSGAPLVPITLAYVDAGMEITFHAAVPAAPGDAGTASMMQGVADAFSDALRANPQDWHMMQKVFIADLDPSRA